MVLKYQLYCFCCQPIAALWGRNSCTEQHWLSFKGMYGEVSIATLHMPCVQEVFALENGDPVLDANVNSFAVKNWSAHRKLMGVCTYNAPGSDYFGNDLRSEVVSSASSCCSLCQATTGCAGFTYYGQALPTTPRGTCYLKYSVSQGLTTGNPSVTTGLPY